ncbi:MAG: hypothetical protein AB1422_11375 [bacterium]
MDWILSRNEGIIGTGNWKFFPKEYLELVFLSADDWKKQLQGVSKPWLCWCLDEEWCFVQQQLVNAIGWTPVVGTDGRYPTPRLTSRSIFIDFNNRLKLPLMWMHFPLEFAHLFSNILAFWHSDVLIPVSLMRKIDMEFSRIREGQYIGVRAKVGFMQRINRLINGTPLFYKRWFEMIGCTTKGASLSQFQNGCGWWRHIEDHPNTTKRVIDAKPYFEHGVGIWFWEKYFKGEVSEIPFNINPYHYSTNKAGYYRRYMNKKVAGSKADELKENFNLQTIISGLELNSNK